MVGSRFCSVAGLWPCALWTSRVAAARPAHSDIWGEASTGFTQRGQGQILLLFLSFMLVFQLIRDQIKVGLLWCSPWWSLEGAWNYWCVSFADDWGFKRRIIGSEPRFMEVVLWMWKQILEWHVVFLSFQVLENYSDAPMTPKQILQVIEAEGLKEMRLVLMTLSQT